MTKLTARRNMSTRTINAPPTRASIEGMFGYSTVVLDDIFDYLPPALPHVADRGNTLGETILIRPLIWTIRDFHSGRSTNVKISCFSRPRGGLLPRYRR